jgi:hypothetical protein
MPAARFRLIDRAGIADLGYKRTAHSLALCSSAVQFCEFVPEFAFAFSQFLRQVDLNLDVKIATLS